MSEPEEEIVVDRGRLVGCRGRVRIALALLGVLLFLLLAFLVRAMLMPTAPQPVKRASADALPSAQAAAPGAPAKSKAADEVWFESA
jgi:hypothetical protein